MWFVTAPEMADPAARLRGGGLQARGGQRPTASRGASRPPWIDRAARASLLAALGRRLPAQAAWRKPERLCIAPRRQPVAAWLRGRSAAARGPPPPWRRRGTQGPRHGRSSLDTCARRRVKVRTAPTRASWVAKARGGGLGVPSSHGGQPVPPGSIEVVRRGRMRWLGAHLQLLSCSLTAARHA